MNVVLDEQLRRYYLDQLGIQCWQSLDLQADRQLDKQSDQQPVAEPLTADIDAQARMVCEPETVSVDACSELTQAVQSCTACALHERRQQALPGRGDLSADVMLLLANPSARDDHEAVLCAGSEGELLEKMLQAIGLSASSVYITSLLKCMVQASHTITPAEVSHCRKHFERQLSLVKPEYILILGEVTARCFFQQDQRLDSFREQINTQQDSSLSRYRGSRVMVSYSPQELMQHPGEKRKAWQDLQQLQSVLTAS